MIITFIVILFCTLIVVVVLFKFLRSEASKTDKGYKLKGAAAGFVVILGFVIAAYTQVANTIPKSQHDKIIKALETRLRLEKWTITGNIEKEGDLTYLGVKAVYNPPEPIVKFDNVSRTVTLSDVLICPERGYPKIVFQCEDYYPFPVDIVENNADYEISEETKTIYIKYPIILEKRIGN